MSFLLFEVSSENSVSTSSVTLLEPYACFSNIIKFWFVEGSPQLAQAYSSLILALKLLQYPLLLK